MNFTVLQRYAPLLSFANRKAETLTDAELDQIAATLAGDKSEALGQVLRKFRAGSPSTAALELLGSPAAQDMFSKMAAETAAVENTAFIKCPLCERCFETEFVHTAHR